MSVSRRQGMAVSGGGQVREYLVLLGYGAGGKRVRRLIRLITVHQKSKTKHKHYPYLLHDLAITRPNHVWCADIIYAPCIKAFCI